MLTNSQFLICAVQLSAQNEMCGPTESPMTERTYDVITISIYSYEFASVMNSVRVCPSIVRYLAARPVTKWEITRRINRKAF